MNVQVSDDAAMEPIEIQSAEAAILQARQAMIAMALTAMEAVLAGQQLLKAGFGESLINLSRRLFSFLHDCLVFLQCSPRWSGSA